MTKIEKLIERFLSKPTDFTWGELVTMLNSLGYRQISGGKTGGSRMRFVHPNHPPVLLHKPHPKPVLKRYQIEAITDLLQQGEII